MKNSAAKILLVEDDATMREVAARALETWGYSVLKSSDGLRAWEMLEDNPEITLVILDVCLPGMDGREFIKLAREHEAFKTLPIIIVSGMVRINEIEQYLKLGASRFLAKPYRLSELRQYTEKLLSSQRETASREYTDP